MAQTLSVATLPTGTVTFVFSDVEGSTRLWERAPAAMRDALARHDTLIETEVALHHGTVVRPRGEGDSRFAVFARASDAVAAAAALQQALHAEPWPVETPLRVRIAVHTGEADLRAGDYYGSAVNRCARLRALAHGGQTLLSRATADLVGEAFSLPDGVTLRDLGAYRLADLERPEHVCQLVVPGVSTDFPALRALDSLPHNLPLQLTSFVGREQEIAEVARLLGQCRLLTLTGVGGTGKTRLALQVAAERLADYADGVWLVELAPLGDPALAPRAVATALGIVEEPTRPLLATLTAALRPKRLLVVLDNCEHLIAACAVLADTLLHGCPRLQILATSREALGVAGETSWPVPSLGLPDAAPLPLEMLAQYEAVRLFVERAAAMQPGFVLTEHNAGAVAQACRRLDGIPLALELAAARMRGLAVEQLAARLDQRFRLLTGGSRTALPRQQTLQATVDWSYDLLSTAEQALFSRLSVFAGGFTLEAAEAVCAGEEIVAEDVLDLLLRLVDRSMVVAETAAHRGGRYRLLETLRQYGREKLLAGGEATALHSRHAAYFLALAEQAAHELRGPALAEWLERLERDHDNLRVALAWYLDQDRSAEEGESTAAVERGLRLACALFGFWMSHAHRREGREWMERSAVVSAAAPAALRARVLSAAGFITPDIRGAEWLAQSVALYRELGARNELSVTLSSSSLRAVRRGDDDTAAALLAESLALAREGGDPWSIANALSYLIYAITTTAAIQLTEERARARAATAEVLLLVQELGETRVSQIGYVQGCLGLVELYEGNYERARAAFSAQLAALRAIGETGGVAWTLSALGDVAREQGDDAGAVAFYQESVALLRDLGYEQSGLAMALHRLGEMALDRGDLALAQTHLAESLGIARGVEQGAEPQTAAALEAFGGLAATQGEPRRALRLAGAAAVLRARVKQPLFPYDQAVLSRRLAAARQALSTAEQAIAWTEGQAMSVDQAIAFALDAPV